MRIRLALLILFLFVTPLLAFSAREGYTKVIIIHGQKAVPNAREKLIEYAGGEVVQQYDSETVAYFPTYALASLSERAAQLGIEIQPRDDFDMIYLAGHTIDARRGVARSLPNLPLSATYKKGESGLYILQFAGPILPVWDKTVQSLGVKLVQYIPYNAYIVAGTPAAIATAEKLPYVQLVDLLHVSLKTHPRSGRNGDIREYIVQLVDAPGVDQLAGSIEARTVDRGIAPGRLTPVGLASQAKFDAHTLSRVTPTELRLQAKFDARDIGWILDNPLVYGIVDAPFVAISDERVALSLTPNTSGPPSQRVPTNPPGGYKKWLADICPFCTTLKDDHFWIGIADPDALDDGTAAGRHNPALPADKVRFGGNFDHGLIAVGGSHATMVAGVAAGDPTSGTDVEGYFYGMGIAPSAGIYTTKLYPLTKDSNTGQDSSLGTSVSTSTQDATTPPDSGYTVRVQNHSYNQYFLTNFQALCYGGKYTTLSQDFDRAVLGGDNNKPIVLTTSAGNQSQQLRPQPAPNEDPFPCLNSYRLTLPPATAKNTISVGSTEVPRSFNEQWECHWSGQSSFDNIAANSMRGTMTAGWYKPDLFAPGDNIASTRSMANTDSDDGRCGAQHLPSPSPPLASPYMSGGGTSFSAPVAAGAAILARRFYEEVVNPGCHSSCSPTSSSPALTKAMLIAGARSMAGGTETTIINSEPISRQTVATIGAFPNNQQGFGRISLEDVLSSYPLRYFVNETEGLTSGQEWIRALSVHDPSLPVKIALVWSDPLAQLEGNETNNHPLVNDLNLRVELGAPCVLYIGNRLEIRDNAKGEEAHPYGCNDGSSTGASDILNNVEITRFYVPAGGTSFAIHVQNVNSQSAQRFALVVYNAYNPMSSTVPLTPPIVSDVTSASAIVVVWTAVNGATGYEIRRKPDFSGGSGYSSPIFIAGNSYVDPVGTNRAYVYQVRSKNSPFTSDWSAPDLANTATYTHADGNKHVTNGQAIAALDITELRNAVYAVRAAAGLSDFSYTYSSNYLQGGLIHLDDISELRTSLDTARSTLGLPTAIYTDPGSQLVRGVTLVKAAHINDLRDAAQ